MRLTVAAAVALAAVAAGCTDAGPWTGSLATTTVDDGARSGYCYDRDSADCPEERSGPWALAIRDQEAWEAFWRLHTAGSVPPGSPPDVDWERHAVVAAVLGPQNDHSHGLQVTGVRAAEDGLHVDLRVEEPAADCAVLPAIGNPFHIVGVERQEGVEWEPVHVEVETVERGC